MKLKLEYLSFFLGYCKIDWGGNVIAALYFHHTTLCEKQLNPIFITILTIKHILKCIYFTNNIFYRRSLTIQSIEFHTKITRDLFIHICLSWKAWATVRVNSVLPLICQLLWNLLDSWWNLHRLNALKHGELGLAHGESYKV